LATIYRGFYTGAARVLRGSAPRALGSALDEADPFLRFGVAARRAVGMGADPALSPAWWLSIKRRLKVDWSGFEIGGVSLLALVPGIVEFCKSALGVKDRAAECLTVGLGCGFIGLAQAISAGLVPDAAMPWITVAVVGLGGGLAIAGYYKLVKNAAVGFIERMVAQAVKAARSMSRQ